MRPNRLHCPIRHEIGNCVCVGGFCTAVPDPVCEAVRNAYDSGWTDCALKVRKEQRLKTSPTIEAEPVRHGRWEWYEEWGPSTWLEPPDIINAGWKCTECGIDLGEYLTAKLHEEVYVGDMDKMPEVDRCPNCGAKMDAKEEAK